jgi:putative membrane protein
VSSPTPCQARRRENLRQADIDDHTKARNDFKAAVQTANLQPPKEEPDATQKATLKKPEGVKGKGFDQAYVSAQTDAHKEAVALLKIYEQGPRPPR